VLVTEPIGRRERKKAQTRRSLADAALRLFMERGFDEVGVKDVADEADVSVTTLFKHFPSKEALLFDESDDIEAALVATVRDRAPGQSILDALHTHLLRTDTHDNNPRFADFLKLVDNTPALREYSHRMWMRHETALAAAIAAEAGAPADDIQSAALAHFVLEARNLARNHPDPAQATTVVFTLLAKGWEGP
jgi:AcrR family transcriptional regulator